MTDRLPDVQFGDGEPDEEAELPEAEDLDEDNDEELAETPQDVIDLLGFDPKDLDQ